MARCGFSLAVSGMIRPPLVTVPDVQENGAPST